MKGPLILSLLSLCNAWWCTGHMLGAYIAQVELMQKYPSIYNTVQSILGPLNGELTGNIANTLTETSCWADDLKVNKFNEANTLHYIDKPYNPQGLSIEPTPTDNIVWAISNFNSTLIASVTAPLEKSLALRFLVHFFGDIHQPLHDTTLFSYYFPNSDYGGNSFKIVYDANINQLHKLWDSAIGMLETDLPRPLSTSSWETLDQLAQWYTGNYTRDDLSYELQSKSLTSWTLDAYMLAIDYVYNGIEVGQTPSPEYIALARQVVMKQIALSGYRLTDYLVSALTPFTQVELYY